MLNLSPSPLTFDEKLTYVIVALIALYFGWQMRGMIAEIDESLYLYENEQLHRSVEKLLRLLKAETRDGTV